VYRGVQRGAGGFERTVAIKRTHRHVLAQPDAREMILREASYASAVHHPNVVRVDDVEEVENELLIVMEFVEGVSLEQLLRRCDLPVAVILAIAIDACAGLHAIHTACGRDGRPLELVHRDVSPQNILIGRSGVAKVTDFGIARRLGDPKQTAKHSRRGKCGYMAPEYIDSARAVPASDVFALAVVLWEALAGRRLFEAETDRASVQKNRTAHVPDLDRENPMITTELNAVIRRALARNAGERWSSAAEFGEHLRAAACAVATRAEVGAAVERAIDMPDLPSLRHLQLDDPTHSGLATCPTRILPDPTNESSSTPRKHRAFRLHQRFIAEAASARWSAHPLWIAAGALLLFGLGLLLTMTTGR
jgi:serine/threonine-protein kinase